MTLGATISIIINSSLASPDTESQGHWESSLLEGNLRLFDLFLVVLEFCLGSGNDFFHQPWLS